MAFAVSTTMTILPILTALLLLRVEAFLADPNSHRRLPFCFTNRNIATTTTSPASRLASTSTTASSSVVSSPDNNITSSTTELFQDFVDFLVHKQADIIQQLEQVERENGSKATFSRDCWGMFEESSSSNSGGITRVLQGGNVIEKGACSLTLIQQGILSSDRAAAIRARQDAEIAAGDVYSACALSIVLHSKSPLVPTFRSDVRVFLVRNSSNSNRQYAWFGGGADLTPYYLDEEDVIAFHRHYQSVCTQHLTADSYQTMKQQCDDYFYLPARQEHRGTGGIFFDDMALSHKTMAFTKSVADTWMASWLPIVEKHQNQEYTETQKQWQLLRRGRYLEFNLLYDRGVKFGLANANPRVEGVMVSAPPVVAYEYNHAIRENSPEAALMRVLKKPRDWLGVESSEEE